MPVVVVMGVAGSGKTTVGTALAAQLGMPFVDGDEFHPPANIAKMTAGHPLSDEDRQAWLAAMANWVRDRGERGGVLGASLLKRRYRDQLRAAGPVWLVHLRGDRRVLDQRLRSRVGHFMKVSMLESQLADLEPVQPDEPGIEVDLAAPPDEIVATAVAAYRAAYGSAGLATGSG
jgi:gluconokinase